LPRAQRRCARLPALLPERDGRAEPGADDGDRRRRALRLGALELGRNARRSARADDRRMRPRIGIGVVGFGWMGQAHARSYLRIPTLFRERLADPVLVACADSSGDQRGLALDFGFRDTVDDWRELVAREDVDAVVVTAPNML